MPRKKRYRPDGTIVRRFDSRANATPAVKYIGQGGYSGLLKDRFDRRSELGRAFVAYKDALLLHLGGEESASTPELILVDMAARCQIMARAASVYIQRNGELRKDGSATPAFDTYSRATRELRSILGDLGLKRRSKDVDDLAAILQEKERQRSKGVLRLRKVEAEDAEEVE